MSKVPSLFKPKNETEKSHPSKSDINSQTLPDIQPIYEQIKAINLLKIKNIIIVGETGTGKEQIAKLLQIDGVEETPLFTDPSSDFVAVNCAAIPESLIENHFFGYVKNAFTGANANTIGFFEQANNGTLFLDEITCFPLHHQAKLLRAIDTRKITKVGASKESKPLNLRIIAATNDTNLIKNIEDGKSMKADLFARLNGFMIQLPPLRERPNDLVFLIESYNQSIYKSFNYFTNAPIILPATLQALKDYSWPQNLRELHKAMESAHVHLIKTCMTLFANKNLKIINHVASIDFNKLKEVFLPKVTESSIEIPIDPDLCDHHEISKYLIHQLSTHYGDFTLLPKHFQLNQQIHSSKTLSPIQVAVIEWRDFLKANLTEIDNLKDIESHQSKISNVDLFMIFDSYPDGRLYPDNDPQFGIKVFSNVISQFGNNSDVLVQRLWSVLKLNESSANSKNPSQKVYANVLKYRVQEEQLKADVHQYFSSFPRYNDLDEPVIEFLAKDTLRIDSKGRIECFFKQEQSTLRYILHSNEEFNLSKIEFLLVEQLIEEEQIVFYLYGEFNAQQNIIGPLPIIQSIKEEFLMKVLDEFEEEKRQLILKLSKKETITYDEPYFGFFDLVEKVYFHQSKQEYFFKLSKKPKESNNIKPTLFHLSYQLI
ncbi:MAG: sigma-54-dependent Fis family transcriptional regulator [Candidatus Cloacimonetes bacterium]|nr:sigma-54-dependent Fis family transcriptional regulator [Candidatus Cloacimonadota bacterium]